MNLIININLDNAAFEDNPVMEMNRILDEFIARSQYFTDVRNLERFKLFDSNGNTVGTVEIVTE